MDSCISNLQALIPADFPKIEAFVTSVFGSRSYTTHLAKPRLASFPREGLK